MKKKISIAIDAMGGDDAPNKTIEGIKFFLEKNKSKKDFIINVFGDEKIISDKIKIFKIDKSFIKIIN